MVGGPTHPVTRGARGGECDSLMRVKERHKEEKTGFLLNVKALCKQNKCIFATID